MRQKPGENEVAEGVLQCNADILAQKMPDIEDLVSMATLISNKELGIFLGDVLLGSPPSKSCNRISPIYIQCA